MMRLMGLAVDPKWPEDGEKPGGCCTTAVPEAKRGGNSLEAGLRRRCPGAWQGGGARTWEKARVAAAGSPWRQGQPIAHRGLERGIRWAPSAGCCCSLPWAPSARPPAPRPRPHLLEQLLHHEEGPQRISAEGEQEVLLLELRQRQPSAVHAGVVDQHLRASPASPAGPVSPVTQHPLVAAEPHIVPEAPKC